MLKILIKRQYGKSLLIAKKSGILLVLLFLNFIGYGQQNTENLIPFLKDGKYGFAGEKGNIIIPAKFNLAYPFFSDHELTMVVKDGKSQIINRKGKMIMEASTDYLSNISIDSLEQIYNYIPEGIALESYCQADTCALFQIFSKLKTNHLFDKMGDYYFVKKNNKVFLIDKKGKIKTKQYDRLRHLDFGEIEYAISEDHTLKKSGLINNKGETLLECVYDAINYSGKGIFELKQSGKTYTYKAPYNDKYKPLPFPSDENKNRIVSRKSGKAGIVDSLKNVILPFIYDRIYPMAENSYLFWKSDTVGILDAKEGILYQTGMEEFQSAVSKKKRFIPFLSYTNYLAFINNGRYWSLFNYLGKPLINHIDGIFVDFQKVANQIAGLSINGQIKVIDKTSKDLFGATYDKVYCIADNFTFIVYKDNQWSWINADGQVIFDKFDEYKYVLANYLLLKQKGKWFFANSNGKAFQE